MSVLNAKHFHDEEAAFAELEAILWPDGPVCPHCGGWIASTPSRAFAPSPARRTRKASSATASRSAATAASSSRCASAPCSRTATPRCTSGSRRSTCCASSKKGISSHQLHRIAGGPVQHRLVHGAPHPRGHARWRPRASDGRRRRHRRDRRDDLRPRRDASQGPQRAMPSASPTPPTRTSSCRWWSAAAKCAATTSQAAR